MTDIQTADAEKTDCICVSPMQTKIALDNEVCGNISVSIHSQEVHDVFVNVFAVMM